MILPPPASFVLVGMSGFCGSLPLAMTMAVVSAVDAVSGPLQAVSTSAPAAASAAAERPRSLMDTYSSWSRGSTPDLRVHRLALQVFLVRLKFTI